MSKNIKLSPEMVKAIENILNHSRKAEVAVKRGVIFIYELDSHKKLEIEIKQ